MKDTKEGELLTSAGTDARKDQLPAKPRMTAPAVMNQDASDKMLEMIERVALDPDADLDKMQKLLDMRTTIFNKNAEMAFNMAMAAAQSEMQSVKKRKYNTHTKSHYADLGDIIDQIKPIYTKHGFSVSFNTPPGDQPDTIHAVAEVTHIAGHSKKYEALIPLSGKGAKGGDVMTPTHAWGSGSAYARRYMNVLIFNLALDGEDDDGTGAGIKEDECLTSEQIKTINDKAKEAGIEMSTVCEKARVASVKFIKPGRFEAVCNWLDSEVEKEAEPQTEVGGQGDNFEFDDDEPAY